jgi:hypothetical protein
MDDLRSNNRTLRDGIPRALAPDGTLLSPRERARERKMTGPNLPTAVHCWRSGGLEAEHREA